MVRRFGVALCLAAVSCWVSLDAQRPAKCSFQISPTNAAFGAEGGLGSVAVSTGTACGWTATSNAAFISLAAGSGGAGSGTVIYDVAPNTATTSRKGTLTVAGRRFTVQQAAAQANQAPTANAGATQAVEGGTLVVLDGSGTDPEGQPITYRWRQTGGPGVALSSTTLANPSFTSPGAADVAQDLAFELVVSDGALDSSPASVTVTVLARSASPDPEFGSLDIGAVGVAGSTASSQGVFTVAGAGADVWGTADSFRYVYQPLDGDGIVVARLVSMQNTHAYAKAGIMLRAGLAPGDAHVLLSVKPNGELEMMRRSAFAGSTSWLAGATPGAPVSLKLTRVGSTVTGYYSKDGATWSKVGSTTLALPAAADAGLVVCSHDTTTLNTSTFDGVGITATAPNLPPTADAGPDQAVAGGSRVTLAGSGTDPEGQPLTYSWMQVGGLPVTLSDRTSASPTFLAPAANASVQAFTFQLVVNDGAQDSSPSIVTVSIPADPTAAAPASLLPAPPAGGATLGVPSGGNLQAAIDAANPGDVIVLEAGGTYTGNFRLPSKGGRSYIMIRSSASFPEGARVTPATAGLARVVSPSQEPVIVTAAGASFYWLEGLELATTGGANDIVRLGDGSSAQNSLALVPHDLVVSHCFIHGHPGLEQKRGIALNSGLTYIADSHIDEIKGAGYDTQAIAGWNGPGPYRLYNNHLSAAGEVFLLGGADPSIQDLVPTDVVLKGNVFTRPTSWRGSSWVVKNLFELKNARQVVVDGNVFENHWQAAQSGSAIVLTPRNQDGRAPWTVVRDVTFINNRVRHVADAFNVLGEDYTHPSLLTENLRIENNIFEDVSSANWGGSGRLMLVNGGRNVQVRHNTIFHNGSSYVYAYGAQVTGFEFTGNIVAHNAYGIMGDSTGPVGSTLAAYFPGSLVAGNVIVGSTTSYPAGNYLAATMSDVGFVDLAGGDYSLAGTSPYRNVGADGKDPGADVTKIPR